LNQNPIFETGSNGLAIKFDSQTVVKTGLQKKMTD
jgi:hypothetical protein